MAPRATVRPVGLPVDGVLVAIRLGHPPHRSPWSHLPVFGTLVRMLYAMPLVVGAIALASAIARRFDPTAFTVPDVVWSAWFWRVMLGAFAGMCVSDMAHFLMDVI